MCWCKTVDKYHVCSLVISDRWRCWVCLRCASTGWILRFRILSATLVLFLTTRYLWLYFIFMLYLSQKYKPTKRHIFRICWKLCSCSSSCYYWWTGWPCTCGILTCQRTNPQFSALLGKVSYFAKSSGQLLLMVLSLIQHICNIFVSYLLCIVFVSIIWICGKCIPYICVAGYLGNHFLCCICF